MRGRWLGLLAAGVLLAGFACARAEVAVPPLKARVTDLSGGIHAGVDRIMRTIEGEPLPPPRHAGQQSPLFQHIEWIVPGLFILMVAQGILNRVFGRTLGAGLTGGVAGFLAWLIIGSL